MFECSKVNVRNLSRNRKAKQKSVFFFIEKTNTKSEREEKAVKSRAPNKEEPLLLQLYLILTLNGWNKANPMDIIWWLVLWFTGRLWKSKPVKMKEHRLLCIYFNGVAEGKSWNPIRTEKSLKMTIFLWNIAVCLEFLATVLTTFYRTMLLW